MKSNFEEKLKVIHSELGESSILLVSKTRTLEEIKTYYDLGQRDFGENRVQELYDKALALKDSCPEIRWHMIGHLQSNKINQLFKISSLFAIHSVDNAELVQKLIQSGPKLDHSVNIFLQFNTSFENEKSGFESYEDLFFSAKKLLEAKNLKLYGLMTMGTLRTNDFENEARRCFRLLNTHKEKMENDLGVKLMTSMGMSQDYKIALEEKSDWIRLGTMMFTEGK